MAGYSNTPLAKKLGIKPGFRVKTVNAPSHYADLLEPLPDQVTISPRLRARVDMVHLFVHRQADLAAWLDNAVKVIPAKGSIWISWPKKASGIVSDFDGNVIRSAALERGLVDVKVCAVDEVWSALKLVIRVENRCR